MQDDIAKRVITVIAETQKVETSAVSEDSTFDQLGIDSLDGLNILFALEEEFGIDVPDEAGRQFASVRQVVQGIELLLARSDA